MSEKTVPDSKSTVENVVVADFQKATRHLLKRMNDYEKFHYVLHGSGTYELFLFAYAKSLGKTLPDNAALLPVPDVWDLLHSSHNTSGETPR